MGHVRTGLERVSETGVLKGRRVGLVTHPAAVDSRLRSAADILRHAPGVSLVGLFGPEHGLTGYAQDLEGVGETRTYDGIRCFSLYGDSLESLKPTPAMFVDLDDVVIDLVDIGSRYYTFQATMLYCLQTAAQAGKRVVILDRPNPLGGLTVEGPTIRPGYTSFIGPHPICTRHGLTMGELARLYVADFKLDVELLVVECAGWRRDMYFPETGLPWVMPSPNMPTFDTALVYPGMCLFEGTNLSEGRGTTRPFEIVGFPGIDAEHLAKQLNDDAIPGAYFRPVTFKPTFQKHVGQICGGVQLHVSDRLNFHPVRTGLAVMIALRNAASDRFRWRTEMYEFVTNPIAIDLLFGSDRDRLAIENGAGWRDISAAWLSEEHDFGERRNQFLR